MTLSRKKWEKILKIVNPNKGDILEQIKEELKKQDEDTYKSWEQKGFNVDHLFDVTFIGETKRLALLHIAAIVSNQDIMKALLNEGANINVQDKNGKTPLYNATVFNCLDNVKYLIKQADIDINAKDEDGKTSLHKAALLNHLEIVKVLLQNRADINAKDKNGNTSFHIAARSGHVAVAQALIKAGADVSITKYNRQTRLHLADVNARNKNSYYIFLHYAVENGHSEIVKALLQSGADINAKDRNGRTLLHHAVENDHSEIVKALLQSGAIIDARDNIGNTPLYCAIHNRRLNIEKKESVIKYIVLFDSNGIKPDFINANTRLSQFWNNCSSEIKKIQGNICGSTMYRLLRETDENELAGLIRKSDKQEEFNKKFNYENEFPIYGIELKRHIEIGKQRLDALNTGEMVSMHFPDFNGKVGTFNRKIVEYLSNKDIQNLRKAAIQAMDEEKNDQLNLSSSMNSISGNQPNPTSSDLSISKGDEKLSETIPKNQGNFANTGSNKNPSIKQLQENNATSSVRAITGILSGIASSVYSGILGVVAFAQLIKDKGAGNNLKDLSTEHKITREETFSLQLNTLGNKSTPITSSQLQTSLQEYVISSDEYEQDEQLNLSLSMDSISSNQSNLTSSQLSNPIGNEECSVTTPETQGSFGNIGSNSIPYSPEEKALLNISASNNKQGIQSEVLLSESESEDDKTVILADTKKKKQAPTQLAEQVDSMAKGSTQPKPATNQQDSTTAELFSTNSSLGDNNLQIAVQSDENQQMNAEKACSNNTLEIPEQILVPSNEKELIASTDYSRRDAVTKTENAGDLHIATLGTQQVILHVSAKLFNKFRKKNAAGLSVEFIADNISEIAQKFLNDGISQAVIFLSSNNSIILDFDDIIKFSTVKTPALEQESDKNEQTTTQLTEHITQEGFIQVLQPKSSVNIRDNNVQLVNESDQPIQGDNGIALMDQSEDDEHFYGALESQDTNSEGAKVNSTKGSGKYSSSSEQTLEIFNRYHSNITASTDDRNDEEFMATTANIGDESNQPTLNTASEGDFTLESNSSLQDTQPKTLAITLPVNDTQDNTDHPTSDSEKNDTTSQNTKRSKRTGIAVSTLAITGVISGIAIAVYSGMLAVGIAVGICFLIAAAVIYRCNNPSNLLKDSNAEVAMNQGQEL